MPLVGGRSVAEASGYTAEVRNLRRLSMSIGVPAGMEALAESMCEGSMRMPAMMVISDKS